MDVAICEEIKRELMHGVDYGSISAAEAEDIYNRCIQSFSNEQWLSSVYC